MRLPSVILDTGMPEPSRSEFVVFSTLSAELEAIARFQPHLGLIDFSFDEFGELTFVELGDRKRRI